MSNAFAIETFQSENFRHQLGNYWMRVTDQIQLLNRFVFFEWASSRVIAGWVPAVADLEWKCEMTKIMWQQMNIADRLRSRKEELSGNTKITIPSVSLEEMIQETTQADTLPAFLAVWFLEINKAAIDAYERYLEGLDPIFDAPTIEILEDIIPKKRKHTLWAKEIVHNSVTSIEILKSVDEFRAYVKSYLQYLGGIDERLTRVGEKPGTPVQNPLGPAPKKRAKPINMKTTETFIPPAEVEGNLKLFMWHYMTEIQVVDPMCYVYYGLSNMPFEFYCDYSRHIWDETRHHQMGVRRLKQMGFDTAQFAIPYGEDAIKELENYYAELTMIGETCSFSRKKKSMDSYYEKGDLISGMTTEIDIVDERSHVRFGKKWIPVMHQNKTGEQKSLPEIIRSVLDRWMDQDIHGLGRLQGNPELANLSDEERKSISHFTFCGKIEFKDLNFDRL